LADLLVTTLSRARLRPTWEEGYGVFEKEFHYTQRCLRPKVELIAQRTGIAGLIFDKPTQKSVRLLDRLFRPDISIVRLADDRDQQLVACEVKLLRYYGRPGQIKEAIGQASIYRGAGYAEAIVILLDTRPDQRVSKSEVDAAKTLVRKAGLHLIYSQVRSERS
jgi:hypothetical protein